ncbi:MAG: hypothetical protein M1826_004498 [Phylliscum demangeonii]|nr:MAG: hypothetical protein M1826_004498 [Phylliscum demangeonii]
MSVRGDPYRSGGGGGGGGGRWDQERFLRERDHYERGRGHVVEERDVIDKDRGHSFEEHDRFEEDYAPRPGPRSRPPPSIVVDRPAGRGRGERYGGRGAIEEEKIKIAFEQDRSGRGRKETIYFEDERESGPTRDALVPFRDGPRDRRRSVHVEREYEREDVGPAPARGPAPRPRFVRRQSSLDTFDRRPMPRYGVHEEHRTSVTIPVPLPRRRRSPPTVRRYEEHDYEEIRVPESDYYEDDVRETERTTREYRFKAEPEEPPRRGKTRMPRRLVEKTAIDILGYPFEEEIDHIVILRPLRKEQIDEVVKVSREIRSGRSSYVREETKLLESSAPPPVETIRQEIIIQAPEPEIIRQYITSEEVGDEHHHEHRSEHKSEHKSEHRSEHRSEHGHDHKSEHGGSHSKSRSRKKRSKSKKRRESFSESESEEEVILRTVQKREESEPVHGPLTMFLGDKRKEERNIRKEIKALEIEEKAVKLERERNRELRRAERIRGGDYVEEEEIDFGDIRVERNKKGKMSLVR